MSGCKRKLYMFLFVLLRIDFVNHFIKNSPDRKHSVLNVSMSSESLFHHCPSGGGGIQGVLNIEAGSQ